MPSLAEGGALWFTDLTAADPYYVMPVLAGLSMLATVELGAMDGMQVGGQGRVRAAGRATRGAASGAPPADPPFLSCTHPPPTPHP